MDSRNLFFPVFLNMENKKVLIIGAGKTAYRKTVTLLKYGADIKIITKNINDERFYNLSNLEIKIGEFSENMLEDIFLVVAGTDDKIFNKKIYEICSKKNILVNNITSKDEMSCRFGSIVETDEFQIGISAKGNPKKSKELKEKLKNFLKQLNLS